jgi:hypothetical protein
MVLTRTEQKILGLVNGMTSFDAKQVGKLLGTTPSNASRHLSNMLKKRAIARVEGTKKYSVPTFQITSQKIADPKWLVEYKKQVNRGRRLVMKVAREFDSRARLADVVPSGLPSTEQELADETFVTRLDWEYDRVAVYMWVSDESFGTVEVDFSAEVDGTEECDFSIPEKLVDVTYKNAIIRARKVPGVKTLQVGAFCHGDFYALKE